MGLSELKYIFSIGANYTEYLYYNEMRWIVSRESLSPLYPKLNEKPLLDYVIENEAIEEDDPRYPYVLEKKEREKESEWLYQIVLEKNIIYDDLKDLTIYPPIN